MDTILNNFNEALSSNILISLLLALVAGIMSSFSPCILSSISLVVSYVGGYSGNSKHKAFIYSLAFAIGSIITFTILGIISAYVGEILGHLGSWWNIFLGILMLLMGLQMLDIINIIPSATRNVSNKKGIVGALLLGILGGMFCAPCSAPILLAILAFVADNGNILVGALLLMFFAIGHNILLIITGSSIALTEKLLTSHKTEKIGKIFKMILSIIIIVIAIYLLYMGILGEEHIHESANIEYWLSNM